MCVFSEYLRVDFIKFCAIYSHRVGVICITHQRRLIPLTNCYKFAVKVSLPPEGCVKESGTGDCEEGNPL